MVDHNAMSTVATRKRSAIAEVNSESLAKTTTPTRMAAAEKIIITLPPEMVSLVRNAVATGEYVSSSEVIRDALRDWRHHRTLRQQGIPNCASFGRKRCMTTWHYDTWVVVEAFKVSRAPRR